MKRCNVILQNNFPKKKKTKLEPSYPEFYERLKDLKVAILPLNEKESVADDTALENLVGNIEYEEIVKVIENIPSPYNEVLYLHYVKDYSVKKTAALLDKKTATVKMQLVRGKRILIEKLSEVLYG